MLDVDFVLLDFVDKILFGLPLGGEFLFLIAQVGERLLDFLHLLFVALALDCLALDFLLGYETDDFVKSLRYGVDFETEFRSCLVDEVNGLVGKESVGDVALREGDCGDNRFVADTHLVVVLIALFQTSEDGDGGCFVRLVDHHFLESAFEGFVFFEILLVFVERRSANRSEFASRKCGLEDIGSIHSSLTLACSDEGVDLVDEEDDFTIGTCHFVDDSFESLFKFTFVLRAGNQCAHVERIDLLCAEIFRHVASDDALCEPLGDSCLARTGFAYEHRVVFGASRQNLQYASDFVVTSDHRVEFAFACALV